jgi:predicted porin
MQPRIRTIVAATALAFCGAAHAETVVYGTIIPWWETVKTTGATQGAPADKPNQVAAAAYTGNNDAPRNRLSVGTTNLGFRGTEHIGNDLYAVWQLESGFQIDQNTGPGLGARDSKIGLKNRWGEIFMGQWDTPYKYISLPVNPIRAGYAFDRTAITGQVGMLVPNTTTQFQRIGGKADASFDRRAGNSVQYWSPTMGGFTARVQYQVNEGRGPVVAGGPDISPTEFSTSVVYESGGLSLRYGYEVHNNFFGMSQIGGGAAATNANPRSKDQGHKFVWLWRIGPVRLTGLVEQLKYHNDDSTLGNVSDFKRVAAYGVVEYYFVPTTSVWFSYGQAQDGSCSRVGGASCSTHNIGAKYFTTGLMYHISKRTDLYAAYYKLTNKESGSYSPGPIVNAAGVIAPGSDVTGAGVGMWHTF